MSKMSEHCLKEKTIWTMCVSGQTLGCSYKEDTFGMSQMADPGSLPTEEAAKRVARAFKAWIEKRYPDKADCKGQYFIACADGPVKVFQCRKPESEMIRRSIGNFFQDQGDAFTASQALAWLCAKERERFETRHNEQAAGESERQPGTSQ